MPHIHSCIYIYIIYQAVFTALTGPVNTGKGHGTMFSKSVLILFWGHVYLVALGSRFKIGVGIAGRSEYFYDKKNGRLENMEKIP